MEARVHFVLPALATTCAGWTHRGWRINSSLSGTPSVVTRLSLLTWPPVWMKMIWLPCLTFLCAAALSQCNGFVDWKQEAKCTTLLWMQWRCVKCVQRGWGVLMAPSLAWWDAKLGQLNRGAPVALRPCTSTLAAKLWSFFSQVHQAKQTSSLSFCLKTEIFINHIDKQDCDGKRQGTVCWG